MPFENWDKKLREHWWELQEDRPPPDLPDVADFEMYPYLHCTCSYSKVEWILGRRYIEIDTQPPGRAWKPTLTVWNSGSAPSYACHVEVLENPGAEAKARKVITLQPSQVVDVTLELTTGAVGTTLIGVCYDPVFDPLDLEDLSHRKSTPMAVIMAPTPARPPKRLRVAPWSAVPRRRRM